MKIYVSGSFLRQQELLAFSHALQLMGHINTASWLVEGKQPAHLTTRQWYKHLALVDLADVARADCIVMDESGVSTTGGRYVEWGFALAHSSMLKILIGSGDGVFQALADQVYPTWEAFLKEFPHAE